MTVAVVVWLLSWCWSTIIPYIQLMTLCRHCLLSEGSMHTGKLKTNLCHHGPFIWSGHSGENVTHHSSLHYTSVVWWWWPCKKASRKWGFSIYVLLSNHKWCRQRFHHKIKPYGFPAVGEGALKFVLGTPPMTELLRNVGIPSKNTEREVWNQVNIVISA